MYMHVNVKVILGQSSIWVVSSIRAFFISTLHVASWIEPLMQPPSPVCNSCMDVVLAIVVSLWSLKWQSHSDPNQTRPGGLRKDQADPTNSLSTRSSLPLQCPAPLHGFTKASPGTHITRVSTNTHTYSHARAHIFTRLPNWKLRGLCFVREQAKDKTYIH